MRTETQHLRQDERLREANLEALAGDERLQPLGLRVGVLIGIAHLAGNAPSQEQWELAEQVAARVLGVRGAANRIEAPGAHSPARTIHLDLGPAPGPSVEP